jgi:cephalosporin hydroxylase
MNSLKKKSENNPIQNSIQKFNYLGINLMKNVKDLVNKNYKSLKNEIKKISEDGRTSPDHG